MTTTCPSCEGYQRLLGDRTVEIVRQHDEIKALKAELADYKLLVRAMGGFYFRFHYKPDVGTVLNVIDGDGYVELAWTDDGLPLFTPELRAELQKVGGG